jgi:hypothetical protein
VIEAEIEVLKSGHAGGTVISVRPALKPRIAEWIDRPGGFKGRRRHSFVDLVSARRI